MPRSSLRRARFAFACVTLALLLPACGGDNPTGPSDDFDIEGAWSWRVTNATTSNATCSVTGVTITFTRNNGALTGRRVATGGGNMTCTINGSPATANYTTNDDLDDLSLSGTAIEFSFATTTGTWEMAGSVTSDDRKGGTATIRVGTSGGTLTLTGPWTATRD
jgi:hypothetical protein